MVFKNLLKEKIKSRKIAVGTFIQMTGTEVVEIVGTSGLDFAIIDLEHGPYWIEKMVEYVRASGTTDMTPICRIPEISAALVGKCLDAGAHGLLIPQVKTAKDAEEIVRLAKYTPRGERGFCSAVRAAHFFASPDYRHRANDETMILLTIENKEAVENYGEILKVEGIDGILMGPGDLSYSLGHPGEWDHPEVKGTLQYLVKEACKQGVAAGMHVKTPEDAQFWFQQGARFFTYGIDAQILYLAFRKIRESFDTLR
jgi:4-hydroxy-2-oxoheptanedioate aldolase